MPEIHIRRNHGIGLAEVKEKVDTIAQKLQNELQADYHWEGDTLHFKRSGASGKIEVGTDYLAVDIKLGMALGLLKGKIEETVRTNLDQALAGAGPTRPT
jgi:putative polyhydroxyalkanoate system protein